MKSFRRTIGRSSRQAGLLWCLLLALSLLCPQGVAWHAHNLDHGGDEYLDHRHAADEASDHGHLSRIHSAYDLSHSDDHDGAVYTVDATPDGVLKHLSNPLLAFALLVLSFAFVAAAPLRQLMHRHRKSRLILFERHLFSPPLRAPPF